ncbi:F0F1 ATP synthase subunit gamma [Propionicimonas sp.]|uniref:F0F1 ATP synthase subunit gamma n=1 Tax=Propionicimonas sp. TaxID=1955623 RepID=UPI00183BE2D0|nr:F0F1 ATP synthase subunit gamma [Propionicimonas sp.]MBU3977458.1 F0F1 ATP synthase subunit gamma [Actinomycetota bacterium]MBA3021382.1 F0F1 ATP synthase subunit gamma [Propionicimonas sp.]MBU3985968.1 F0F1 ATP synthase subunit gamma [Actinomycetota bacterium]MBU4008753.1 F0F1 ATP synthase subunit gamma [Actinomycetota bacterium]MBU4066097.1 F0F1 ATP synthase subunit gamma [Actinomycetota bacterium]
MGASLRELRQRRKSVTATKKITRAMELIASSRVLKAQQQAAKALPYTRELNRAVSAVATYSQLDHPLTRPVSNPRRVAVLFITSDRGMNGAYSSNVLKTVSQMRQRLDEQGIEMVRYGVGRKGIAYMTYRGLELAAHWSGFSDLPTYDRAVEISDRLLEDFLKPYEEGGVDEIWTVYTRMQSMLTQTPRARRILPLEVVEGVREVSGEELLPLYEFEPSPEAVLDSLLPLYVRSRIWFYLLQSAASQLASQQKAMKSATDNAQTLIERLTREANQARQSEITQEISEIVGGASALADLTKDDH